MEQSLVTFSLRFKYDRGTSAASYALRNIAVGYLYECLLLKEVILRQSDKAEYQDSGDEKILKLLFNHFESEEEGVSNVETEQLGKIALIEPEKLVTALKVKQSYQRQQVK
ncbi:hypothetical protein RGQ29_004507 [Quercus rubra]|uniref:Uncharacterized protein n=1 Tax=Quercus rubra TaxID=3512 RepID=A0AAN7ICR7_QUERU|nr:hypothetical protein RGQ29_004507 [Quercus rubra]KAK4569136.1 hypothetical protein RGQ29_004507 [Quercus rubra]